MWPKENRDSAKEPLPRKGRGLSRRQLLQRGGGATALGLLPASCRSLQKGTINMAKEMSSKQRLLAALRGQEPDRVPIAPMVFPLVRKHFGSRSWVCELQAAKKFDFDPMIHLFCFDGAPVHNNLRFLNGNYTYAGRSYFEDMAPGVTIDLHIERLEDSTIVQRTIKTPAGELRDVVKQMLVVEERFYGSTMIENIRGFYGPPDWIERLIKGPEDLERVKYLLTMPTKTELNRLKVIRDAVGENGLLQVDVGGPFDDLAEYAMDVADIRAAYLNDRPFFDAIIKVFWEYQMKLSRAYLEAGVESLNACWMQCGESAGWTPEEFRELFLPLLKEHVELAHEYGAIFDYLEELKVANYMPMLVEAGADAVHTLCPPPDGDIDLAAVKRKFGDRISLRGNLDSLGVAEKGTPQEVDEAVRQMIEIAAAGGGYILSVSDTVTADWPDENVRAFFGAGRKYGNYAHLGKA